MDDQTLQRFESKINKSGDCWLWTGTILQSGYGQFWYQNKGWRAHKFSWVSNKNTIPPDHVIRHKCSNRHCVRVDHLETGTQKENVADMIRDGTRPNRKGERSPKAKLTADQVIEIRRRSAESKSQLAKEFGVGYHQILKIINKINWKHI